MIAPTIRINVTHNHNSSNALNCCSSQSTTPALSSPSSSHHLRRVDSVQNLDGTDTVFASFSLLSTIGHDSVAVKSTTTRRRRSSNFPTAANMFSLPASTIFLVASLLMLSPLIDAFLCNGNEPSTLVSRNQPQRWKSSVLQVATINSKEGTRDNSDDSSSIDVATAAKKLVLQSTKNTAATAAMTSTAPMDYSSVVNFDWKLIAQQVFENDSRPIILFDGVCNLCNGGVNFAIDHDRKAKFRFASLQSKVAQSLLLREGRHPTQTQNIVLVTPTRAYFKSQAVAKICSQLDLPLMRVVGRIGQALPKAIRDPIYKFVSRHRFILGENESCRLDLDGEYTTRFVSDPTLTGNEYDNA